MSGIVNMAVRACLLLACTCIAACGGAAPGRAPAPADQAAGAAVPAGTIVQAAIPSRALNRSMAAALYLPPGYQASNRYPVLYLFYGYGGNQNSYFGGTLSIDRAADRLIAANAIAPLIIVVPDYANSFAVNTSVAQAANSAGGTIGMYEDYLIGELIPYIDSHFGTDARRERRYVGGISMGGFAALHLGLKHPDLFSKIGGHSAALWNYSAIDQFHGQRDWLYASAELRAQRDPILLAASADVRGVRFYLDAGSNDRLRIQDAAMHSALQARGASSEFHQPDGGHDVAYWNGQLDNYLHFYSRVD